MLGTLMWLGRETKDFDLWIFVFSLILFSSFDLVIVHYIFTADYSVSQWLIHLLTPLTYFYVEARSNKVHFVWGQQINYPF